MTPFTSLTAPALPLVRDNIDTDAIIPSREMKAVSKKGLADGLFAGWRYTEIGGRTPNPDFVLNDPDYANAQILLGGDNFGCGSSREHAVWALAEYGFRAIIAPSFNPIFFRNCVRNGVVPAALPAQAISALERHVASDPRGNLITVDLENNRVQAAGRQYEFELDSEARFMLLHGLDMIDMTNRQKDAIEQFAKQDREARPWAYPQPGASK